MRTPFLISVSLALGVAAAGCSADGSSFASNLAPLTRDGVDAHARSVSWSEIWLYTFGRQVQPTRTETAPGNVRRLRNRWFQTTGCSGSVCGGSSPAVADGVVYVGSYDGNVYAFNAATGVKIWSFPTGGEVFSTPAVVNGMVDFGSDDHNVDALNAATGNETMVLHYRL
jgi:outer membrane protein assembly factor BamB